MCDKTFFQDIIKLMIILFLATRHIAYLYVYNFLFVLYFTSLMHLLLFVVMINLYFPAYL